MAKHLLHTVGTVAAALALAAGMTACSSSSGDDHAPAPVPISAGLGGPRAADDSPDQIATPDELDATDSGAVKFLKTELPHIKQGAKNMNAILGELGGILSGAGDDSDVFQLGEDAQTEADYMSHFYDELLTVADPQSDDQMGFLVAVKDLKSTCSALAKLTENVTGPAVARFKNQVGPAIHEWNDAIATIWVAAGKSGKAPVIRTSV